MTAPRNETATDVDSVRVDLGARGYDILVGAGLLAAAGHYIRPLLRHPRVVVITDSNVAPLYLAAVETALGEADIECTAITLPAGEQTKDFAHLEALAEDLLAGKVGRDTTLVALGGGVIGDLAGFAAAITMRGMDFVQIPTTLLAQVDSAVGGKTGINTRHGKNLVGAFHQPRLVLSDIATLDTLPERELVAGYAEVVKYGLIRDAAFFRWLETNGLRLCGGDTEARRHAVAACCAAKAAIVAEDEREAGRRALLNLGHTFGHALEAQSGFGDTLLHGEAVAIGMVLAFELSARLGLCRPADTERVRRHLSEVGLPVGLRGPADRSWSADGLLVHMARDKKVLGGKLGLVLVRGIGEAFVTHDVDAQDMAAVLDAALGA
ncbi:MAG: 3-dehydroquinate synthase [Rhodospirillales bacterium]|jgi:3-dehydroquinate synthase|nr:3-dehydroquinate synthase [Rhodospirillales bacterium]MDP6775091.1 3-dehydroquinate synthase [Rhodospirillales bacterium]